jgi:polygalacturonase
MVKNIHILNYPTHCFSVTDSNGIIMENIILDTSSGDKPNKISNGKPAAHNTDGFGFARSNNVILRNSKVLNQDDCVAITSGKNITVSNMYCVGGHGLSIGSIGGKDSTFRHLPHLL